MVLAPRAMIRFFHADAVVQPKRLRPATVADGPEGGRYSLFYGSTFKQRGHPRDAIVVDPREPVGSAPRELADHLGGVIDERTYFHGSMMSETEGADPSIQRFPTRFPSDLHDELVEQAQERLLAFRAAFMRLAWIQPKAQGFALHAIWWELKLDLHDELALTLLLYEGLSPTQIATMRWHDATDRRTLLPRTQSLLGKYRETRARPPEDALVFGPEAQTRLALQQRWESLRDRGRRARPRIHLPEWSRIPDPDPTADHD